MPPQRTILTPSRAQSSYHQAPPKQRSNAKESSPSTSSRVANSWTPWKAPSKRFSHGSVGLHEEIEDFYAWIVGTPAEARMRQHVVDEISALIKRLYPAAKVDTFGSFKTGLYLPNSDLDLIVFGKWQQLPFVSLQEELIKTRICTREGVKILDKTTVPILKITHEYTGLKVDVSFNMVNGINTATYLNNFASNYPCMPKLFLLLKQYLYQRDLNEVFTGGISSYALAVMLINFLQQHPRMHANDGTHLNLGVLLLEFLDLYGTHFNYNTTTIRCQGRGSYITKEQMRLMMQNGQRPGLLSIEDPVQPGHDICQSMFGAMEVKQAFEYGFRVLNHAIMDPSAKHNGILDRLIKVAKVDIEFREWVNKEF
ncbi:Non-canonical poly(A) RNA polymerase PAPD5 [Hypsibius exemplaris]|uniref:polynucleotide adenylyltransferase n=1 Tax=Hypsibius exemplaris TaxID=2072580 RepID=A0A9X6NB75_HYPEX|nr:Non-canonical poly(A) RNA polymerase PAPD5 [Hypsibius exemplaris]